MNTWLLILYSLPTRQNAGRVQLWRKLKKFGAVALRTSAYVLPDAPVHYERLQWLARQIRDDGGEATLIRVADIEGLPHEKVIQLFNDARARDYVELVGELSVFLRKHKKRTGADFSESLEVFRNRYQELRVVDYFDCPKAQDALMLLRQLENLLKGPPEKAPRLERKRYLARKWLTRPRPEIDRVGSAWLIKRFIDKDAEFVFAATPKERPDATPYDMFDVEFSHHGDNCTFETLAKRFGIEDKGLLAIGEMIHDADLEDGKFKRSECIGIDRVLKGFATLQWPDEKILAKGFELFDALYATLRK